jgi:hypothetical protein
MFEDASSSDPQGADLTEGASGRMEELGKASSQAIAIGSVLILRGRSWDRPVRVSEETLLSADE